MPSPCQSLARAATASGATLIHYSTDFVFDGTADRPYREDRRLPAPEHLWHVDKLLGE